MKTIYFVTGNKSKFREAKTLFNGNSIKLIQKDLKITESASQAQKQVVVDKAEKAFIKIKKPVIVDDTGVYFEGYKNFPGTYTKTLFNTIGFKGIQRLLNGTSRKAQFKTMVCYKDRTTTRVFSGIWRGKILPKQGKGFNKDWQYNTIFFPDGYQIPLSEIPLDQRIKHSHRKKAFDKLKRFLKNEKHSK